MYPSENLCGFYSSIHFELNREAYEDYEYFATLAELSQKHPLAKPMPTSPQPVLE